MLKHHAKKSSAPIGLVVLDATLVALLLAVLLLGVTTVGNAMLVGAKLDTAAANVALLVPDEGRVSRYALTQAVAAGRAAMSPYDTDNFGVELAILSSDMGSDGMRLKWRETFGLRPFRAADVRGFGGTGGASVMRVSVAYEYVPLVLRLIGRDRGFVMRRAVYRPAPSGPFIESWARQGALLHVNGG